MKTIPSIKFSTTEEAKDYIEFCDQMISICNRASKALLNGRKIEVKDRASLDAYKEAYLNKTRLTKRCLADIYQICLAQKLNAVLRLAEM